MAGLLTIPQVISVGRASIYLSLNYSAQGALWGARVVKYPDPVNVAMFTDILKWRYDTVPTDETLRGTANYAVWLYGIFQLQARALTGGGSITPVPPIPNMPNPLEFVISSSSIIPTGSSSLVIPQFIGYNIIFARDNIPQTQINTGGSYFFWNKVTGLFSCVGVAIEDELFSINPV